MRLVFVSSGWLCGVLNPVKSLYKQTYTTAQRRRRTENNEAEDRPSSFLFTFHWWIWAHDLTYAHTATTTHTHAHTRMWEHTKALRGASWTYPAQLPSHPYSSTLPSPTFVWNAAYTGPLKAPYRASNPPCTPRPSSPHTHPPVPVNPGLCPEHSPGTQPQPLNEWTRDTGTVGERSRNCSYQPNVVKLICSSRAATRTHHTCRLKSITLYAIYNSYAITLYKNTGNSGSLKVNNYSSSSILFQYPSHL